MKRLLLLLGLMLVALSGCTALNDSLASIATNLAPDALAAAPLPNAPDALQSQAVVTLYYRYLDEPLLAQQTRMLSLSPDQSPEMALIAALISGPDVQSPELTSLFPTGVKVLSTVRQERTLFVTLSRHIMNDLPDEPSAWQEDPVWRTEVPLRRELCMQSLVATITENCAIDSVVVLVEQSAATDSLRLRECYYRTTTDASLLAAPLRREDRLLLSPTTALQAILTCWQNRDWTRLQRYASAQADWSDLPHLLESSFTGPTLSPDGNTAIFVLSATLRQGGTETALTGRVVRLHRAGGRWVMEPAQILTPKEE